MGNCVQVVQKKQQRESNKEGNSMQIDHMKVIKKNRNHVMVKGNLKLKFWVRSASPASPHEVVYILFNLTSGHCFLKMYCYPYRVKIKFCIN